MKIRELFESQMTDKEIHKVIRGWRDKIKETSYLKPFGTYKIEGGEVVHTSDTLVIFDWMLENGELPIKFKSCRELTVRAPSNLKSFKNFPETIFNESKPRGIRWSYDFSLSTSGFQNLGNYEQLTSLEGCPKQSTGIDFSAAPFINLSRIDKHIDYCQKMAISPLYKGPLLSLLKLKRLDQISCSETGRTPCYRAVLIIRKYIEKKDRDILACQDELIENGLKDFAKL